MVQTQESFSEKLAFGQEGEHIVGQILLDEGVTLLPLYQFQDIEKAPLIYAGETKYAAPDLTCFKDGQGWFVEVKSKRRWVKFTGELETGLDQRKYDIYKQVQETTGLPVYLCFRHIEEEPTGIYYAMLDSYTRYWDGKYKGKRKYEPEYFYNISVLNKKPPT